MANYGLVVPFLNQSSDFAHGVEFGMLYARMRGGGEDEIRGLFLVGNQDQILLAAGRTGWHVECVAEADPELASHAAKGWFYLHMRKGVR